MRRLILKLISFLIKFAISLRYKVTYKGLESLNSLPTDKSPGTLFLPNHPSQLDGFFVMRGIEQYAPRPAAVEYLYEIPLVSLLLRLVRAIPVPNLDSCGNSVKRYRVDQVMNQLIAALKEGDNFLFYPSGRLKVTGSEMIGGASGVRRLLQAVPGTTIVLVHVTGLWGSTFSRGITNRVPKLGQTFWNGFKHILKNLIFFTPRRQVTVEYSVAPQDFPYTGTRLEINKYLESFYNKSADGVAYGPEGEPLTLKSFSMWKTDLPEVAKIAYEDTKIDLNKIPKEIQDKVLASVAATAKRPVGDIHPDNHLAKDLGFDSLDATELLIFLEDNYEIKGLYPSDLTTVATIMALAAKQKVIVHEDESNPALEKRKLPSFDEKHPRQDKLAFPEGKTLQEVFLKACDERSELKACGDGIAGVLTYGQFKLRTLLLAEKIRALKGDRIGILLPATVSANIVSFACMMAGKVPVMINWTVGPRHLNHVIQISKIEHILTSWKFLDGLENIDLGDINEIIITLESIRDNISILDKLKALFLSKKSPEKLLTHFGLDDVDENAPAVLLFTSGTETLPKGVPLSHSNLLSNVKAGLERIGLTKDDILFSFLPPFHSFGFVIAGIFPLLSGLRVAYSPDPTNSAVVARGIEQWSATMLCSPPSFLKSLLQTATKEQIKTLSLFLVGAEKTPKDLFAQIKALGSHTRTFEGYGITECSPILTVNTQLDLKYGVGKPVEGVEISIVHPETHEILPPNMQGLILAHGPNVFSGYLEYNGPSPFITTQGKLWYNTGDLGYLDTEGNLNISGRVKRFVKIGAEMISLGAIEDALLGVAKEKNWFFPEEGPPFAMCSWEPEGERPQLILLSRSEIPVDEINDTLKKEGFSNLYRISKVKLVDEIPITGTGKGLISKLNVA